jgi:DNA-directed RNA polymerase subunit E'/Rpb7
MENTLKVLLKEKIKLEPKYLIKKYAIEILNRLKNKVEGKCSKHGYIKEESIEIYKITPGVIELSSLSGMIIYDVYFYAELCNPVIGNIVKGIVKNTNRFGILVESPPVMDIIIAKNSVNIQSEIDLEDVRIDQELTIEIMGKKFELNDKRITIIGRIVKDIKPITKPSEIELDINNSDDEAEEEVEVDESEEEEEEEEIEVEAEEEEEESIGGSAEFDIFDDSVEGDPQYEIFEDDQNEMEYENDD